MGAGTSTTVEMWEIDGFLHSLHTRRLENCWNLSLPSAVESRFSAQFALCVPVSVAQLEVQKYVERNLRHHLTVDRPELLEFELHDHKDVHNRSP